MDPGEVHATRNGATDLNQDSLSLQSSDHPGLSLVSVQLDGRNYLLWSRSIQIALAVKDKLCFIDGTVEKPNVESPEFIRWRKVDSMVFSWMLNSIKKELVESFFYTNSARELWLQVEETYVESNGSLLYQIQSDISSMSQGNQTVAEYFSKLKKLWDEHACLRPVPICRCGGCTCGASRAMTEMNSSNKLLQFLTRLNELYDNIRNQILVMEPLPTMNKANSMILRVEKQREIHVAYGDSIETNAFFSKSGGFKGDNNNKGGGKKREFVKKSDRYCEYCHKLGHMKETCFKLHGVPDWHKELTKKRGSNGNKMSSFTAYTADTPLQEEGKHERISWLEQIQD